MSTFVYPFGVDGEYAHTMHPEVQKVYVYISPKSGLCAFGTLTDGGVIFYPGEYIREYADNQDFLESNLGEVDPYWENRNGNYLKGAALEKFVSLLAEGRIMRLMK